MHAGTAGAHKSGNIHPVIEFILRVFIDNQAENTVFHPVIGRANTPVSGPGGQVFRNPFIRIEFLSVEFVVEDEAVPLFFQRAGRIIARIGKRLVSLQKSTGKQKADKVFLIHAIKF